MASRGERGGCWDRGGGPGWGGGGGGGGRGPPRAPTAAGWSRFLRRGAGKAAPPPGTAAVPRALCQAQLHHRAPVGGDPPGRFLKQAGAAASRRRGAGSAAAPVACALGRLPPLAVSPPTWGAVRPPPRNFPGLLRLRLGHARARGGPGAGGAAAGNAAPPPARTGSRRRRRRLAPRTEPVAAPLRRDLGRLFPPEEEEEEGGSCVPLAPAPLDGQPKETWPGQARPARSGPGTAPASDPQVSIPSKHLLINLGIDAGYPNSPPHNEDCGMSMQEGLSSAPPTLNTTQPIRTLAGYLKGLYTVSKSRKIPLDASGR
ncbi:hypermethylated in cancer 1 protein-like [Eublepharis macularius]|uniref:Hypermethylated in cancer 1 protein-like n=1 Tax=Eublepharis macularius TaxID=481883 RepID=A0AA97KQT0_EUBMA|nr:hypermethylated in cancer 1 protein-like [Eublepharis macularius]